MHQIFVNMAFTAWERGSIDCDQHRMHGYFYVCIDLCLSNLCYRHGWMLSPRFELVACLQQLASIELRALTTSSAPVYNDVIMVTVALIAVPLPLTLSPLS